MNLVEISEKTHSVMIDLKYGTEDNFTKEIIYASPKCFLHHKALICFEKAIDLAQKQNLTFRIFDAFRPQSAQVKLWDLFPNPLYVMPPDQGSCHTRGIAMDLTLTFEGHDLDMGTPFDDFTEKSHHGAALSPEIARNRYLLLWIMVGSGFLPISSEWWHYQLPDVASYPLIQGDCGMMATLLRKE